MMTEHLHFYPDDEKILSFRPRVVLSGLLNGDGNWSNKTHSHNFCEIMYITKGAGVTNIENVPHAFEMGDIVVYNTGVFHGEHSTEDKLSILFFAVDNLSVPGLTEGCLIPDDAYPVIKADAPDEFMRGLLLAMVHELTQKEAHYKAITTSIATMFCYYILRLYEIRVENPYHVQICDQAKRYIDENFNSDICLETIANSIHVSKFHFIRIFKETIGISPMKYLLSVRLSAAKEQLCSTERSIQEIAEAVGYENPLTFSRVFKNSENISPTAYRNNTRGYSMRI